MKGEIIEELRYLKAIGRRDLHTVRRELFLRGFKPQDIESGIKEVYKEEFESEKRDKRKQFNNYKTNSKKSKMTLLFVFFALVSICLLIFFLFLNKNDNTSSGLDVNIVSVSQIPGAENVLEVKLKVSSFSQTEDEVSLEMRVNDGFGKLIEGVTKKDKITLQGSSDYETSLDISSLNSGSYSLAVRANTEKQNAEVSKSFSVEKTNTVAPIQKCQNGMCNDNNKCTRDRCINESCVFEEITPCCGNGYCDQGENEQSCSKDCFTRIISIVNLEGDSLVIANASQQSKSNPILAEQMCTSILNSYNKDVCFNSVAFTNKKISFCSKISDQSIKDNCYTYLATPSNNGCFLLTDPVKKESCESMIALIGKNWSNR